MFDTDKFIVCIHEKAPIWDKSTKEYSDKMIREKSWIKIGEAFYDNWWELDTSEKIEKVKEMKNKWRHIRDNFFKFRNRGKSGEPRAKTKKYVYADALQFLLSTIDKRKTSVNMHSTLEEDSNGEKDENENDNGKEQQEQSEPGIKIRSLKSLQSTSCQRNITPFQRELLKKLNDDISNQEDADKSFLLSILPDYKKLNDDEKLDFRLSILQFFKNCQQNKNIGHSPIHSSTQTNFHARVAVNHAQKDEKCLVNVPFHLKTSPSSAPSPSMT